MGAPESEGTPGEIEGADRAVRGTQQSGIPEAQRTQEIFIPVGDRLGNEVIEFKNVSKAYGDRLLIDNLNMKIPAGAIVGIIGPNGAGSPRCSAC